MLNRCLAIFAIGVGLLTASLIPAKANIIQTATATLNCGPQAVSSRYLLAQTSTPPINMKWILPSPLPLAGGRFVPWEGQFPVESFLSIIQYRLTVQLVGRAAFDKLATESAAGRRLHRRTTRFDPA
jgi:hypothetical protein